MKTKIFLVINLLLAASFFSCKKDTVIPLEAAFESQTQQTVAGGMVEFIDRSTGNVSKWKWTFEGGEPSTSNLSGPEVTYALPGTYAVTLEVTNAGGGSLIRKESFITVTYDSVTADFEADKTTAVQGDTLTFTDLSTGLADTWLWEFIPSGGTAITSTDQHPVIRFDQPGIYTVKLTASNPEHSNQAVKTDYINILDPSAVEASFTSNATATYEGGSINFSDASAGNAETLSWTFEGGSPAISSDPNPVVNYNAAGRYKVTLVASNPDKSSSVVKEQYILVVPGNGLQAFFPFNGNAGDISPNQLVPAQTGTVDYTGADRKATANSSAIFDGASYLNIADHSALNLESDNYSISCWIKTTRTNKMMIWQESGAKGAKDNQTWLRIGDNSTTQFLRFATEDATGGTILSVGSAGRVSDGSWHHVVCVREGTNIKVYVDGVKISNEGNASSIKDVSNESGFKIGAQEGATSFSNYFNGQLDDLIIYKRALSAQEVLDLYNL